MPLPRKYFRIWILDFAFMGTIFYSSAILFKRKYAVFLGLEFCCCMHAESKGDQKKPVGNVSFCVYKSCIKSRLRNDLYCVEWDVKL